MKEPKQAVAEAKGVTPKSLGGSRRARSGLVQRYERTAVTHLSELRLRMSRLAS